MELLMKLAGRMFDDGGYMCKIDTISGFPVIKPTEKQKNIVEKYVDKLSTVHEKETKESYENYIMDLYGLNEEEKNLVKSDT